MLDDLRSLSKEELSWKETAMIGTVPEAILREEENDGRHLDQIQTRSLKAVLSSVGEQTIS